MRADVDRAGQEMALGVMRGTVCCGGISVGICSVDSRRTGDRLEKSKDHSGWKKDVDADVELGFVENREHNCDTALMVGVRNIYGECVCGFR